MQGHDYDLKIQLEIMRLFVFRLLQLQWKQDLDLGLELISKAIEIDNKCDFAYETMGTIEVQRWDLKNRPQSSTSKIV